MHQYKTTLQDPKPGDTGWLIQKHGEIYSSEFNFTRDFELDIAKKIITLNDDKKASYKLWIAYADNHKAGSIAVSKKDENTAFINFVMVLPHFRNLKIASMLVNNVKNYASKNNFSVLRLETYSCLKNARSLYKKAGFKIVEKHNNIKKYGHIFDQEFWEFEFK